MKTSLLQVFLRAKTYSQGIYIQWHLCRSQRLKEHKLLQIPFKVKTNTENQSHLFFSLHQQGRWDRRCTGRLSQFSPAQPGNEPNTINSPYTYTRFSKTNTGILPQLSKFKHPNFCNKVTVRSKQQFKQVQYSSYFTCRSVLLLEILLNKPVIMDVADYVFIYSFKKINTWITFMIRRHI